MGVVVSAALATARMVSDRLRREPTNAMPRPNTLFNVGIGTAWQYSSSKARLERIGFLYNV